MSAEQSQPPKREDIVHASPFLTAYFSEPESKSLPPREAWITAVKEAALPLETAIGKRMGGNLLDFSYQPLYATAQFQKLLNNHIDAHEQQAIFRLTLLAGFELAIAENATALWNDMVDTLDRLELFLGPRTTQDVAQTQSIMGGLLVGGMALRSMYDSSGGSDGPPPGDPPPDDPFRAFIDTLDLEEPVATG